MNGFGKLYEGGVDLEQWHMFQVYPIYRLPISVKLSNALLNNGIASIDDLLSRPAEELLALPNIGPKSVQELREVFAEFNAEFNGPA